MGLKETLKGLIYTQATFALSVSWDFVLYHSEKEANEDFIIQNFLVMTAVVIKGQNWHVHSTHISLTKVNQIGHAA